MLPSVWSPGLVGSQALPGISRRGGLGVGMCGIGRGVHTSRQCVGISPAPIVELLSKPGWRMLPVAHYCANTSTELGDGVFSKKPTNFLLFGVSPDFQLNVCNNDCPHRIDDGSP